MNSRILLLGPWVFLTAPLLVAQSGTDTPQPPPVTQAYPAAPRSTPPTVEQHLYGPTGEAIIPPATAEAIVARFKKAYGAEQAPRVVVYVNRALSDSAPGVKLVSQTEHFEKADNTTKTSADTTYTAADAAPAPTLADQQTVREVERLFGRVFRNAGAQLADAKAATALLPDQPGIHLVGEQAAKEREALKSVADIAIEVLISSRNLTVPGVAGDATYAAPDIQATAIRLKDSAIIGQAAASDIIGQGAQAGRVLRQFDVRSITEATALALMEDMLTGK